MPEKHPTPNEIAKAVIQEMNANFQCPNGMSAEDTKALKEILPELKEFTAIYSKGKWSINMAILGLIALGLVSSLVWGLWDKFLKPITRVGGH